MVTIRCGKQKPDQNVTRCYITESEQEGKLGIQKSLILTSQTVRLVAGSVRTQVDKD